MMAKKELLEMIEIKIQISQMEKQINDLIKRIFTKEAEIKCMHGGHIQFGTVVDVGYRDGIRVLNNETGKKVWIRLFNLFEAHGLLNVLYPKLHSNKTPKANEA